jgi:hypothetical protein
MKFTAKIYFFECLDYTELFITPPNLKACSER